MRPFAGCVIYWQRPTRCQLIGHRIMQTIIFTLIFTTGGIAVYGGVISLNGLRYPEFTAGIVCTVYGLWAGGYFIGGIWHGMFESHNYLESDEGSP